MKKRLLSMLLVLVVVFSCSVSVFADSVTLDITDIAGDYEEAKKNPYLWYFKNQMLGVQDGTGVTLVCPNGDYKTLYTGGALVTCPYDGEALVLADAGGVIAKKIPEGIGRKDIIGYQDNNGTPSVTYEGDSIYKLEPYYWIESYTTLCTDGHYAGRDVAYYPVVCPYWDYPNNLIDVSAYSGMSFSNNTFTNFNGKTYDSFGVVYGMKAPVAGLYKIYKQPVTRDYTYKTSSTATTDVTGKLSYNAIHYFSDRNFANEFVAKDTNLYWQFGRYIGGNTLYRMSFTASELYVSCTPSQSAVTKQVDITINKNTWNGNIYVDNTNNLTYIYPQYTTINENNETITNISTNPIIYNSETKQYYAYDSVTQNYYYIIYNENPATPTPSPSPTPDPDNPGGGSGGSGTISTPETGDKDNSGGSSWNPFKWLADLLKDIVEKILKAIWKLITSIFSFLLWLLSLAGKLFPFIPTQAITAITAGAVIVTVIRIIKFITGR